MIKKMSPWIAGLLVGVLTACGAPPEEVILTDREIEAKIVRTAERKSNGVFYSIEEKITDSQGDTWRVSFLKIFRESGKVYNYIQIRVDPRYNFTVSTVRPMVIGTEGFTDTLPNEAKDRNRIGYYEVTKIFPSLLTQPPVTLGLPVGEKETRMIIISAASLKGWQKVNAIDGPNVFYPAANY